MKPSRILLVAAAVFLCITTVSSPAQDLIVNGSFEVPVGTYSLTTNLPGWYVSDNVDVISYSAGGWPSYEGDQSIDLSGCATNGAYIEQAFPTVPGRLYRLSFQYANNIWEGQEARGTVKVVGSSILVDELLRHSGSTQSAMNYTPFVTNFLADSSLTTLRFTHVFPPSSQCQGLALDVVEVSRSQVVTVNVLGKCNPWLAGMPDGSIAGGGYDTAPC